MKIILTLCLSLLFYRHSMAEDTPIGPIEALIRTNLIGYPVIHNRVPWIFDPDVALRRRKQFIEINGDKADKLIERLGLGIDGRADERLAKQRQRDEGHLGGLNFYLP